MYSHDRMRDLKCKKSRGFNAPCHVLQFLLVMHHFALAPAFSIPSAEGCTFSSLVACLWDFLFSYSRAWQRAEDGRLAINKDTVVQLPNDNLDYSNSDFPVFETKSMASSESFWFRTSLSSSCLLFFPCVCVIFHILGTKLCQAKCEDCTEDNKSAFITGCLWK